MSGIPFQIRRVDEAQMDALLTLYCQCEDFLALGPNPRASREMVLGDLALLHDAGGHFCGIYSDNDQLMGVIDYQPSGFEGQDDTAFLELLMLGQPWRGQGLGRAVFAWLLADLRTTPGVRLLKAGVQANNAPAVRFWRARGFKFVSGPTALPDGTTCYALEIPL